MNSQSNAAGFDILPGDMILNLMRPEITYLIKSFPRRRNDNSWMVEVVVMTTKRMPDGTDVAVYNDSDFYLENLRRIKRPKDKKNPSDGKSVGKFRSFKLIRMPRGGAPEQCQEQEQQPPTRST